MTKVLDAVDGVRDDLRALHQKIDAATAKSRDSARADLQEAAAQAQRIAGSLKTIATEKRTDASDRLAQAASKLEQSASSAKDLAAANQDKVRQAGQAMLTNTRSALQNVSEAIAAKRAEFNKQNA